MADVTFGYNGRGAEMWRLHRAAIAMNGVAIPGRSLMSMNACYFWDDWMSTDLLTLLSEATSMFRLLPVVNGLHTPLTVQSVKKLVCLKDWSDSMDWTCELNNSCDFNKTTDWYQFEYLDAYCLILKFQPTLESTAVNLLDFIC